MGDDAFDVVIVGAGPGGYVAALRAVQLGLTAACVDPRPQPGGTCLHVGCIPSKALLHSSHLFHQARKELAAHGIAVETPSLDLAAILARKEDAVATLTRGVDQLVRKGGVELVRGRGRLAGAGRVEVETDDGDPVRTLRGEHVVLAAGSATVELPGVEVDERRILSSTGALTLDAVPDHLVVIGAGYIGLELGSVWSRLGARVTCLEATDRILPGMDADLARDLGPLLEEQGLEIRTGCAVSGAEVDGEAVRLSVEGEDGTDTLECTHVLVAVGRRPASKGLGLEEAGVETDERGFVRVGPGFRTSAEGVHAVGDLAGEPMLAHKAMDEGLACIEALADAGPGYVHYAAIPAVVYTWPEAASVGASEEELRARETSYRVGRASLRHNPRAVCTGETKGFAKILADAESDRVLGAHLLGPDAGTVIHEVVAAVELGGAAEELGRTCHGHPTLNEAVREAALAVHERPIHG